MAFISYNYKVVDLFYQNKILISNFDAKSNFLRLCLLSLNQPSTRTVISITRDCNASWTFKVGGIIGELNFTQYKWNASTEPDSDAHAPLTAPLTGISSAAAY